MYNVIHFYRALEVITRIEAKLTGRDFVKTSDDSDLAVDQQVDRLIKEATSVENLCQLYPLRQSKKIPRGIPFLRLVMMTITRVIVCI